MAFNIFNLRCSSLDTLSEISESDTFNSDRTSKSDSQEDLITKICFQNLHEEKYRVDRRKLQHLLIGDNEDSDTAETFFQQIMEDTNTAISWPSTLKLGAKYRRDPYVKIAGQPADVQMAKDRIAHVLNPTRNRVTMKMDVSYTDHAHIIGKGGLNIKRVMEETRCHVHFPDSNRMNGLAKSNQVSIAGDIECVEKARSRVRSLAPVIFSFELQMQDVPDSNAPYVVKVQQQFNVQVAFRTLSKLHAIYVMVKGVESEVQQVKEAAMLLIDYMSDSQTPIQISMEISPNYHAAVVGKNHSNLKAIIQNTNTQIIFPDDSHDITISGNIHEVYSARQQIMGLLPLVLMFDLPEGTSNMLIEDEQIEKIQNAFDVTINFRLKVKQNILVCIIKGAEKYTNNVYEARQLVLNASKRSVKASTTSFVHMVQQSQVTHGSIFNNKHSEANHFLEQFSSSSLSISSPHSSKNFDTISDKRASINDYEKDRWYRCYNSDKDNVWKSHTPTNTVSQISNTKWSDLSSLLNDNDLEKYVDILASQEIDLRIFPSLTESDLVQLGVIAFGARRKMLLIISELNKPSNTFAVAPGAERKSSTSTSTWHCSPRGHW